ncbi:MAG TPA: integrase [Ktedonobacteraceae bacterium]|nr:integrase [Ktedonobacteraceae bacterium]
MWPQSLRKSSERHPSVSYSVLLFHQQNHPTFQEDSIGKRPGAKYVAVQKLNAQMSTPEMPLHKRQEAKAAAKARGESLISWTDGKMRAFETRRGYQNIVMRFVTWCQHTCDLHDPEVIELFANRLATEYLRQRMEEGKSAWTLKTERSALRLFFGDRTLAEKLELPARRREHIKRSRLPAKRDRQINLANWQHVIQFCLATGMRREELRDLYVREVTPDPDDAQRLVVFVRHGKGGKQRFIHVFPGREQAVLAQVEGRDPEEHVFSRISGLLDIHSYRRQFAQELYELLAGKPLPSIKERLDSADLDKDAALVVSRELGHNRTDIVFGYYLV